MEPEVQCLIHKVTPIISILSRINPIHYIRTYFFKVDSNIALSTMPRPRGLFPIDLPINILKALLPSSVLDTCSVHLNILDLITLAVLGERYKL